MSMRKIKYAGVPFAFALWLLILGAVVSQAHAEKREKDKNPLQRYMATLPAQETGALPAKTTGSLWTDESPLFMIANDLKARRVHDIVTIAVSESTLAQATGDVTSQRDYAGNSAITALGGHVSTGGVNPLFAASSSTSLKGKGASNSQSTLRTTLAAEVVAVMTNGNMVVEARRSVKMNNELRTVILRGVVRPGDISPSNVVSSAALANLEIEMKGKGVVSDGTRPNNLGIRWLWKVLGF
ncbi:flagellar L-ring protein [Candidatus Koribacter versatilis Ellin345]|uniref:Flagellar L-ring protein n=2 Tax=Candidatus Korobacter versatilis TaxID=658062 RepID=Q1IMH4_KORVE|nr:flagellar L-ring protein [Candidatus Koribacter versatilis Ellin345]